MLGRPYSLAGTVVHGDHLGRQLGFPTANLDTAAWSSPQKESMPWARRRPNLSRRVESRAPPHPQATRAALRIEAHLLDFDADIYGQELEVTFIEKLREEKEFTSLPQLKRQIARDIEQARNLF